MFLAGNERPIQFPSHSLPTFFNKPVSDLIVITANESCFVTQVRLHKCHTYLTLHHRYLTERCFFFFLRTKIRPHISLDTREASSLWSDGPYVLFMSSEHLLVWMSKIIRLPQDFCPTGCKWTLESRLQTTCQGSPPPEESFNTSAEVSWVTDVLERLINVIAGHTSGQFFSPL